MPMEPKNLFYDAPESLPIPCGSAIIPMINLTQIFFHWHFWVLFLPCEIYFYSRPTCDMGWDFTIILHLMLSNKSMSQTYFSWALWPHFSVIGQKETSCPMRLQIGRLDWIIGKISSFKGLTSTERDCAGKCLSHHLWRYLKDLDVWLGTWFSSGLESGRLTVGINDLKVLL